MELSELVGRIGQEYDPSADFSSPAQQLLKAAGEELQRWLPTGYVAKGSGGLGNPAIIPWIAVFDPDETTTAQRGMYVVYLYAADRSRVFLTLMQGVTEVVNQFGHREGMRQLRDQATAIRGAIPVEQRSGLSGAVDLDSTNPLAARYEAGTIMAREYSLVDLPSESAMADDLSSIVRLYQTALDVREDVRASTTGVIVTTRDASTEVGRYVEFKPKNDSEYRQTIAGRSIVKSRKHETLVRTYGEHLKAKGFEPATNVHPRDMTAERDVSHWLIEAKTVQRGDGVSATRDAIGQLLAYRHFLYEHPSSVSLLALFNEPVGDACTQLLESLGIAGVWSEHGNWLGSPSARAAGLCSDR